MKNKTENSDLQVSSAKEDAKDSKNEEIQVFVKHLFVLPLNYSLIQLLIFRRNR